MQDISNQIREQLQVFDKNKHRLEGIRVSHNDEIDISVIRAFYENAPMYIRLLLEEVTKYQYLYENDR